MIWKDRALQSRFMVCVVDVVVDEVERGLLVTEMIFFSFEKVRSSLP